MTLRQEHYKDLILHVLIFHLLNGFRLAFGRHVFSHIVEFFELVRKLPGLFRSLRKQHPQRDLRAF